ncbi:hypothetical protein GA363_26255 [Escherichia coli]|nr:hypothetical protein [Escherichia coli]
MGRWWRYKWITFHPSLTITRTSIIYTGFLALLLILRCYSWSGRLIYRNCDSALSYLPHQNVTL